MGTSQYNPLASESGQDSIARAIQAIGLNKMGNLSQLNTKSKTDLVSAINECKAVFDGYLHSGHFYREIIIDGYYHEGAFYEDSEYTTEITPVEGKIYKDITSSDTYAWDGEIQEYYEETATEITGQGDALYDELSQKKLYRWNGTAFVDALGLGTASALDVPTSGDASTTQVVKGDDSRLLAVADKISKSQTAGLVKNDGTIDTESYTDEIDAIVNVYGGKNFDSAVNEISANVTVTNTDTGYHLQSTSSIMWSNYKRIYKLPKNLDFTISSDITIVSGHAAIIISGSNSSQDPEPTSIKTVNFDSGGKKEVSFNSGNYEYIYIAMFDTWDSAVSGDVTYSEFMIRDARISDSTYVPYAMTNRELTENVSDINTFTQLNIGSNRPLSAVYYNYNTEVDALEAAKNAIVDVSTNMATTEPQLIGYSGLCVINVRFAYGYIVVLYCGDGANYGTGLIFTIGIHKRFEYGTGNWAIVDI